MCIEYLTAAAGFSIILEKYARRVQATVATFPALSRKEQGYTACEHLSWQTAKGITAFSQVRVC